ncbi:hypothetical protein D3C80_1640890 [compost metagenome]
MLIQGKTLFEKLFTIENEITDQNTYKDAVVQYIYEPDRYLQNAENSPVYENTTFSYTDEAIYLSVSDTYWYDCIVTINTFNTNIQENQKIKKKVNLEFKYDMYSKTYKIKYADIQFIELLN